MTAFTHEIQQRNATTNATKRTGTGRAERERPRNAERHEVRGDEGQGAEVAAVAEHGVLGSDAGRGVFRARLWRSMQKREAWRKA